ncbi:MAG: hypothetical protein WBG17_12375 [Burkholderiaceae bacterium]
MFLSIGRLKTEAGNEKTAIAGGFFGNSGWLFLANAYLFSTAIGLG